MATIFFFAIPFRAYLFDDLDSLGPLKGTPQLMKSALAQSASSDTPLAASAGTARSSSGASW